MTPIRMLAALLALTLAACTTGGLPPAPTFTLAPPIPLTTTLPVSSTETPGPDVLPTLAEPAAAAPETTPPVFPLTQPATPLPAAVTLSAPATIAPEKTPPNCLRPEDYEPIANQYLLRMSYSDLKSLWEDFEEDTGSIYDLMSSFTDLTNTYAHATTYSRMLLVGEYPAAIERPGAVGSVHCAVLIYKSGDDPEIGTGIIDATLNGVWSGYAYGLVKSEPELRQYVQSRVGKPVIARYQVSQDPRDATFVRNGFFSPVMRLLWENSYYTRFSQNPDMLRDNVGQPRGPSLKELMTLMTAWPEDLGVFLDYLTDPIL